MTRRGFGFPLVLIAVGLAALLGNLGVLPFSWLAVLALWPLFLVIAGIDLLLAHRAPLAALALDVAAIGVGIALLVSQPTLPFSFPFAYVSSRHCDGSPSDRVSIGGREGAKSLSLHLIGGAGTFRMSGGASGLVEASSDAANLSARVSTAVDRATVRLTQCGPEPRFGARHVEVLIASDVPTSLELTGGAGSFDLDLRDVKLTDARLTNGASSTTLLLPRPSGPVPIRVTGGASSLDIDLGGADARVETTGGLTTLNTPESSQGGIGRNSYETPGYASARDRYTITVTGGVSSVSVR